MDPPSAVTAILHFIQLTFNFSFILMKASITAEINEQHFESFDKPKQLSLRGTHKLD